MASDKQLTHGERAMRPCPKCGDPVHPENTGFHVCREALTSNERLYAALERARPCVKESLNHWDRLLLAQEKAPRSNAPHMLPDHYINTLRDQVSGLSVLMNEIDVLLEARGADTSGESHG